MNSVESSRSPESIHCATATNRATTPSGRRTSGPHWRAGAQNQQLFLPIITNVAALAGAALGSPGGMALSVLVVLVVVGGLMRRHRQRNR